jgi:protocatechuate 3,4-dioxygenase beta subunit
LEEAVVGLLNKMLAWMQRNPSTPHKSESMMRICRFEQIERREMLSASPIQLGVHYLESSTDTKDDSPDQFTVTFTGGAEGTSLTQLVINTDKNLNGKTDAGELIFHTAATNVAEQYQYWPFSVLSTQGIDANSVHCEVINGGMQLKLTFDEGFEAGDVLVFGIDVDEVQDSYGTLNSVVEGGEFQWSYMAATFEADHYKTLTMTNTDRTDTTSADFNRFLDFYDFRLEGKDLDLPADNSNKWSAAAIVTEQQELLPITLSGTVYDDTDLDGILDNGESGISGVTVTLYQLQGNVYKSIATTDTATDGTYSFTIDEEGTYKVIESQPSGYYSTGAEIGTVNGQDRGDVYDENTLDRITLDGGDDSIHNNFGEAKEVSISGYVYHDLNNNGVMDPGEKGIEGAKITLVYNGSLSQDNVTVVTESDGSWSATGLAPGTYTVIETQPGGYFDGIDAAGTVNGETRGTAVNPGDRINCVYLASGQSGINYDFGELQGCLSGYVYVDVNYSETYESGTDTALAGIPVYLKENGTVIATGYTNEEGFYRFCGLGPGEYTIQRGDVGTYIDAADQVGSQGGTLDPPDAIASIVLDTADTRKGINYNFSVIAPATISGHVYASQSNTGDHADGDPGIAGVTVTLYSSEDGENWATVATTTTNANGYYAFTGLVTGLNVMFKVVETQPTGWRQGQSIAGTIDSETQGWEDGTDVITEITGLVQNTSGVNYDFTEIKPVTISGYVFQDGAAITYDPDNGVPDIYSQRDGQLTADDTRLAGVTLVLADGSGAIYYDDNGDPITTVTDANGYYEFTGLLPDTYTVIQLAVNGYIDATDTPGPDAGVQAQWVNGEEAQSLSSTQLWAIYGLSTVPEGSAIAHINAGIPGSTIVSNNFSLVVLATESEPDEPSGGGENPSPMGPLPFSILPPVASPLIPAAYYAQPSSAASGTYLGGGGFPTGSTWHLSVIDGGQPRATTDGTDLAYQTQGVMLEVLNWSGSDMNQAEWILADANGNPIRQYVFGQSGAWPVTGDWRGDGITDIGMYADGEWFLDLNGDGKWDDGDLWARLGLAGDQPVTGDWDGDGKADIGVFGSDWVHDNRQLAHEPGLPSPHNPPKNRFKNIPPHRDEATVGERLLRKTVAGKTRSDVIDHVFRYGTDGDVAVSGDWTGCGITSVGVFRQGSWYLDVDGDGKWSAGDILVHYGQSGDLPVVGDWTGDGVKKLGVFRKGTWYLDVNNDHVLDNRDKVIHLGAENDLPVVGDWTGDGTDKPGIYRPSASGAKGQPPAATTQTRAVSPQSTVSR